MEREKRTLNENKREMSTFDYDGMKTNGRKKD